MLDKQAVSEQLFYNFRLEDHVPARHLLRSLDKVLRFDGIRAALSSYYSHTGRHRMYRAFRMVLPEDLHINSDSAIQPSRFLAYDYLVGPFIS